MAKKKMKGYLDNKKAEDEAKGHMVKNGEWCCLISGHWGRPPKRLL